jgi:hypothetical protein
MQKFRIFIRYIKFLFLSNFDVCFSVEWIVLRAFSKLGQKVPISKIKHKLQWVIKWAIQAQVSLCFIGSYCPISPKVFTFNSSPLNENSSNLVMLTYHYMMICIVVFMFDWTIFEGVVAYFRLPRLKIHVITLCVVIFICFC